MAIEIRETTVTPDAAGSVVQLHISDVAPDAEGATFRLVLLVKMPPLKTPPLLAQLQRAAMARAQDALTPILQDLAADLSRANQAIEPR
jgi:hypothetical protein